MKFIAGAITAAVLFVGGIAVGSEFYNTFSTEERIEMLEYRLDNSWYDRYDSRLIIPPSEDAACFVRAESRKEWRDCQRNSKQWSDFWRGY